MCSTILGYNGTNRKYKSIADTIAKQNLKMLLFAACGKQEKKTLKR